MIECVLVPVAGNIDFGSSTKKYQDHILCSYAYKLISADDERYSKLYKTYFGEDVIDKLFNDMIKEIQNCS